MKRELNQNLSGNEVYYTNSLISIVKNMLSNKLHRQKGSNVIPFSYQIGEYIRPANRGVCCQRGVRRTGVSALTGILEVPYILQLKPSTGVLS
jgi:hypothetical protein